MSGMADEMTRRLEEDGGAGLADAGAVPGSDGGSQAAPSPPSAGTSNSDIGDGRGAPDTIPYARFKEVNDAYSSLKGFEPLIEYGYDSDSLGRLAAFEQQYIRDPIGTIASMVEDLDLPQELKDQFSSLATASGGSTEPGPGGGNSSTEDAKPPELPDDVKRRLEYVDRLQAREAEAESLARLEAATSHWDDLDKQDGISLPADAKKEDMEAYRALQYRQIAAVAGSGQQFSTIEELVQAARQPVVGYRTSVLGGAVRTGRAGAPLAVPGSAPAPAGPVTFKNIRDATKAAEEAISRGELPAIRE